MSDENNNKPSIFQKALEAGSAYLDAQIHKAKNSMVMNKNYDDDFFYAKTIQEDPSYAIHASGWKEKPHRLQNGHLKQMSTKDSVIAAIIQTRQNQVAAHSKLVKSERDKGWRLRLRNEEELLEKIKEELKIEMGLSQAADEMAVGDGPEVGEGPGVRDEEIQKAEGTGEVEDMDMEQDEAGSDPNKDEKSDDAVEEYNWELERKAKEKLESQYREAMKAAEDFILNCGEVENRPFLSKKWTFDGALRAWVRDSLTYDLYASEIVPNREGKPHHFFPIDGATVKFSSSRLKDYKETAENFINLNILYPENEANKIEDSKVLELDAEMLDKDAYKYVQVVRGKIERAYTEDELKVGMRNPTTDIYNNGYGVSELELVVSLVTGHLNAEFYNQAYFTQGFSAKGILHIKAAINRRKLESVRQQWQHMLKGARNSFQTPIFAGVDEVEWIPLTQNHNDIGFEGWMRYLVKMICSIYQIDPQEIGIGFKDEGGAGGGLGGENTREKLDQSKDKGLYPLIRHIENYVNECILKPYDDRFIIQFTGTTSETQEEAVERLEKLAKFAMTVNETREELGLPPLPGMDDVILNPDHRSWYDLYSKKAEEQKEQSMIDMGLETVANQDREDKKEGEAADKEAEGAAIQADRDMAMQQMNNDAALEQAKAKAPLAKSKKVKVEIYETEE